jgi:hypothetical protein
VEFAGLRGPELMSDWANVKLFALASNFSGEYIGHPHAPFSWQGAGIGFPFQGGIDVGK